MRLQVQVLCCLFTWGATIGLASPAQPVEVFAWPAASPSNVLMPPSERDATAVEALVQAALRECYVSDVVTFGPCAGPFESFCRSAHPPSTDVGATLLTRTLLSEPFAAVPTDVSA